MRDFIGHVSYRQEDLHKMDIENYIFLYLLQIYSFVLFEFKLMFYFKIKHLLIKKISCILLMNEHIMELPWTCPGSLIS